MEFTIYTMITDNGDGSSSTHYFKSEADRDKAAQIEEDRYGIPAEPGLFKIHIVNGELESKFFSNLRDWDE